MYVNAARDVVFVSAGAGCAGAALTVSHQETEDSLPQSAVWSLHHSGKQRLRVALSHSGSARRGGRRILHQRGGQASANNTHTSLSTHSAYIQQIKNVLSQLCLSSARVCQKEISVYIHLAINCNNPVRCLRSDLIIISLSGVT